MPAALLRAGVSGWHGGLAFPNASNTGATLPGDLIAVPGSVTSGPGWAWNGGSNEVVISSGTGMSGYAVAGGVLVNTGATGVTISGCSVAGTLATKAAGTTVSNCAVTQHGGGGSICVQLEAGASGTTVKDCTLSGADGAANRVSYGVSDGSGGDLTLLIQRCSIFNMRVGASMSCGTIQDCYIHDFGFIGADHTDGIDFEGSAGPMSILHNTILLGLGQTAPVHMNSTNSLVTGVTVQGNLLAGGGFAVYAGNSGAYLNAHPTPLPSNIVITGNWFSTMFFAACGLFGQATDYASAGTGNVWSGNTWYDGPSAGQLIAAP